MVVLEVVRVPVEPVSYSHPPVDDIDTLDIADKKADMTQHLADGIDDIGQVEIARCDLVQHRSEKEEILPANECNFEVGQLAFFELKGGVKSAKAATENKDTSFVWHMQIGRADAPGYNSFSSRSSSPNDQACNGQPAGVCGGSPSAISETWPRPACSRCS